MVVFEIRNREEHKRLLGYLLYYEQSRRFFSELLSEVDEWSAPFIFSGQVKKKIYSIDSIWSAKFVNQRIIPSDRQNLGTILKEHGLREYDEFKLLQLSEGRCAQDELYLVRIAKKDIVPEILARLDRKVIDVMPQQGYRACVFFKDGKSAAVDVNILCGSDRLFRNVLRDEKVFRRVFVSPGGQGIEWGEERFLSAERLRECGEETVLSYEDLMAFVKERLSDSAEAAKYLHCSRQYIKQLADKERLVPVRESANAALYRKGALEAGV